MFREMRGDPRIDFEQFKKLLVKAMRMRQTKKQVDLLFNIMDADSDNKIRSYDLRRVSGLVSPSPMSMKEAQEILLNCSLSSQYMTREEFHYVIKQDGEKKNKPD